MKPLKTAGTDTVQFSIRFKDLGTWDINAGPVTVSSGATVDLVSFRLNNDFTKPMNIIAALRIIFGNTTIASFNTGEQVVGINSHIDKQYPAKVVLNRPGTYYLKLDGVFGYDGNLNEGGIAGELTPFAIVSSSGSNDSNNNTTNPIDTGQMVSMMMGMMSKMM